MKIDSYTLFGRWPYWEIKTKTAEDMLFLNPHVQLAKITTAEISDEAKRAILGGNMARILGLEAS